MNVFRKRRSAKGRESQKVIVPRRIPDKKELESFKINFQDYMGQTVTIYVNSGGLAGKGFTGVLMLKTETYVRLLVLPSVPPACSLGSACDGRKVNLFFCALCPYNRVSGAIAEIPVAGITAFVHNAVSPIISLGDFYNVSDC